MVFPAVHDEGDFTLHYMVLWAFVLGAALIWTVLHLQRNSRIRATALECRALRSKVRNILQHSREVLYCMDQQNRQFEFLSPSCFSLTGYAVDELQSMRFAELLERVHPEDHEAIMELIGKLFHRTKEDEWSGVVEYRFLHRDGQYRFLSDHLCVKYNRSGEAVLVYGSVRDVTRIARLEDNMRILEKKFQDGQKMAGLGLLASGIAHDFNNLMTVILGNAELALLECGGSDGGVLDEIKHTTLRAAELANQMLVYTGKTSMTVGSINLNAVVKEMGALLDVSISKKVSIQYCLDKNVPLMRGDVSQVRQVAMNLITNASEAIGDQPGVIAISIHAVELRAGELEHSFPGRGVPAGRYVRLEVSDTGAGMSRETMQRIFDPLFTTKITGRGLGLAALLNAVERHNGAVEVKSELGQGTVFRIYFPAEEECSGEDSSTFSGNLEEWRGYGTVLIADDEEAIRDVTAALLERVGFRVLTAVDGLDMVDQFTEHAEDISLLLMDVNMPRLNGQEAALSNRHINPKVPIVFMSGYPREQVMERFGEHERTGYIRKPFQGDELVAGIRSVMESKRD
ncbi:MAG: ATP-binding protein [Kiritimatiellales bacterium]